MPATQVYFKQKNYREAKELSDALGRMTIEETTVTDSGRVQEFVQGRALATPEELINLKNEVIVFTPDTWPLKLALTSPVAYEQALEYPPPERERHEVSEFVRTRGRTARQQQHNQPADRPPPAEKKPRPNKPKDTGRNERERGTPKVDKPAKEDDLKRKLPPKDKDDDIAPDAGDVWRL